MPGSPPISTKDPGTIPPPKTLLSSESFKSILGLFDVSISFILIGFDEDWLLVNPMETVFGFCTTSSTNEFHSLQALHCPSHLGYLAPQF